MRSFFISAITGSLLVAASPLLSRTARPNSIPSPYSASDYITTHDLRRIQSRSVSFDTPDVPSRYGRLSQSGPDVDERRHIEAPRLARRDDDSPCGDDLFPSTVRHVTINIGTPPYPFRLIVDTGSGDLAIKLKGLQLSGQASSVSTEGWDTSQSSTYTPATTTPTAFHISYADNTQILGNRGSDIVAYGALSSRQSIDPVSYARGLFPHPGEDGILGLDIGPSLYTGHQTFLQTLADNQQIASRVFGVVLDNGLPDEKALTLGKLDQTMYKGGTCQALTCWSKIKYYPVNEPITWLIQSGGFQVGPNGPITYGFTAHIDTGSYATWASETVALDLYRRTGAQRFEESNGSVSYWYRCDADLPQVFIRFGREKYKFDTDALRLKDDGKRPGYCQTGVQVDPTNKSDYPYVVVGATFLKSYFLAFDVDNKRVGFAERAT
ncbi:hypothetical protein FRB99_001990 [Tulasnella sp. 403]|nr:hypothetical protein FRB99_001990 [Tulasnella sp. 403]